MRERRHSDRFWGGLAIASLFAGSVVLGSIGWLQYLGDEMALSWTDIAYRLMTLFTVNASFDSPGVPLCLDIARFLAPIALAGTAIFVAMGFFRSRLHSLAARFLLRGHAVFYGCDERTLAIAADIIGEKRVAFIARKGDDVSGAIDLGALALPICKNLHGSFASSGLRRADCLFVMTESDSATQEVARAAEEYLREFRQEAKPSIFVGYSDDFSLRIAREQDEASAARRAEGSAFVRIFRFNPELHLARAIVDAHVIPETPVDREFRVAVFGFGKIGQALAFEAAQMAHLPDIAPPCIVVSDVAIRDSLPDFLLRHPGFLDVARVEPIELADWKACLAGKLPDLALISLDDAALAFETARVIRQLALVSGASTRVVVIPPVGGRRLFPSQSCCGDFLADQEIVFADSDLLVNGADIIMRAASCDAIAKGIHYSWLAKEGEAWDSCAVDAEWSRLSDVLRDSNRYAARHLVVKLRYLGWKFATLSDGDRSTEKFLFSAIPEDALDRLGRMEHNRWSAEKYLAGYLPIVCADADRYRRLKLINHLHANLVPWEELSLADQAKDLNALRFVNEIAAAAGLALIRA